MPAEILSTETPALFRAAVLRTAAALRAGEVVAVPTETVYGLAANALDAAAVARIYEIKGRPSHNPIIVHVSGWDMARSCAAAWPEAAGRLARAFWPGALTLVLPKTRVIPDIVTAGGTTVGIRWPAHPFMQALIRECGFPLAAPSANPSNEISPTRADHVLKRLGDRLTLIVDGGASAVGIESTVVDLSEGETRILRPGMIHEESLAAALDDGVASGHAGGPLRSPGMLPRHYSPRARVVVLRWETDRDLGQMTGRLGIDRSRSVVIAHTCLPAPADWAGVSVIPHDPEAYARALYAEWHRCDEQAAAWIVMEAVPGSPEWRGITDRLARAAEAGPA